MIRTLVADKDFLFCNALKLNLQGNHEIDVVGTANDAVTAVAEAQRLKPEVALVDMDLPRGGGTHTTQLIRRDVPTCKVVVIANHEQDRAVARAIEAGALGALTKSSPLAQVRATIRGVHAGRIMVPDRMWADLITWLIGRRTDRDDALRRLESLSRREREVLALLIQGASNQQIADVLSISPQTARTHVHHTLLKLGVHSRLEAVAYVRRHGLTEEVELAGI